MAELDKGAASVYIGVDPCYQNYANETEMPIVTPAEVEALVANGTLQVVRVEDADDLDNVGVIVGSEDDEEGKSAVTEPVVTAPVDGGEEVDKTPPESTDDKPQEPAFSDF